MKKIILLVCIIAASAFMLTACNKKQEPAQKADSVSFDPSAAKTMGDILVYENTGDYQQAYSDKKFVFVFTVDGVYYRAAAKLPKEVSDVIWGEEYDENREQKVRKLISALEIDSIENLSEQIPPQEELNKLIGKTGQELFDDGWTYWSYDLADMNAGMTHGAFSYNVHFKYEGEQMLNTDDFDFYEAFKDLPVASVTFEGLGDAANPE